MEKTLAELAQVVGGKVIGDGEILIRRVAPIDEAAPGEITFLANPRYRQFLADSAASAIIVGPGVIKDIAPAAGKAYLESRDPYLAFARILQLFNPAPPFDHQVSRLAYVDPSALIADAVTIFPHVYVAKGAKVGRRTALLSGVFLGENCEVGEDCVLHPNAVVREGCRLGDRVILHAGVVIGSDGFGYAGQGNQRIKIPQIGVVVVEDDVEIGANTTVDRATLGSTVIGRGSKIDNLVQIAHNVVVGENSIIAAQVGIAGSTRVGKDVTLAGKVGIVNHITVGDGAIIGPGSGIVRSVPPGAVLSGWVGAKTHREWVKIVALLHQLPRLWSALRDLDKKVTRLGSGTGKGRSGHARR